MAAELVNLVVHNINNRQTIDKPEVGPGGTMIFKKGLWAGSDTFSEGKIHNGPTIETSLTFDPTVSINNSMTNTLSSTFGMGLVILI